MIIHYLSASRLKTYLQCSEKYFQTYENGLRSIAEHLRFGTLIHKVFERWFQEDKDIKDILDEEWRGGTVVNPTLYKEACEIVKYFTTHGKNEGALPLAFEKPFAIDILNDKIYDTDEVDFEDSKQRKAFLKELEEADAPIIFGYIDRVEYDGLSNLLRVVDYKTSRIALSSYEAQEDEQMSMYALVCAYLYPEYENVELELHYVRLGTKTRTYRSDEELSSFKDWLINMYYIIKADETPIATLNKYCGWCDARHQCVPYKELLLGTQDKDKEIPDDFEQLDKELDNIKINLKILSDREKEITKKFKDKLKETDNEPIDIGDERERYVTNNARVSYDVNTVISLFPENYERMLSVKKIEVDKVAKGNDEAVQQLESTSSTYFIEPTLRKRKRKE